jgi:hypothetical protein
LRHYHPVRRAFNSREVITQLDYNASLALAAQRLTPELTGRTFNAITDKLTMEIQLICAPVE